MLYLYNTLIIIYPYQINRNHVDTIQDSRFKILYYSVYYEIHRIYVIKMKKLKRKKKNDNIHTLSHYVMLYMCDICRVVYMSLWSSGQRELERREVLVLPPRGRVGWSFSLVWAFGESTRILIYVIRIVHKLPLKLIYVHYTTRNPAIVLITKIM